MLGKKNGQPAHHVDESKDWNVPPVVHALANETERGLAIQRDALKPAGMSARDISTQRGAANLPDQSSEAVPRETRASMEYISCKVLTTTVRSCTTRA